MYGKRALIRAPFHFTAAHKSALRFLPASYFKFFPSVIRTPPRTDAGVDK